MSYKLATIGGWEEGRNSPDLAKLIQISDFFKVTLDELIKIDLTKDIL